MNILHVWDCSGVSGVLAKYQRRLGHTVDVVVRDGYDGNKQKEYYGIRVIGSVRRDFKGLGSLGKVLRLTQRTLSCVAFYGYIAFYARHFDIVHIHSQYLVSLVLPFKKKIIEFHGSDIRCKPSRRWLIDQIVTGLFLKYMGKQKFLVSTPDLLNELDGAVWLPNPVDTDLFKSPVRAVYFHSWYESGDHAKEIAGINGWDLTVVDRKTGSIAYCDMPAFLRSFQVFIDRKEIASLSKLALEALAVGLKVVDWEGKVHSGLPSCHLPVNVAKVSVGLYEEVINH